MKRFAIGDIHGGYKALLQCLSGGWNGKLTIMDVDSHKYWQSDLVPTLYPNIPGRHIN